MISAIDPGKEKCGIAIFDTQKNLLEKKVVPRKEILELLSSYILNYKINLIILGNSVFGKELEKEILKMDLKVNLIFVSEKDSSRAARQRYWQENKPKGFWKIIPTSLRVPPCPIDDYAAVILGERYFKS